MKIQKFFRKNKAIIMWILGGCILGFFVLHPVTHAITEFFHLHDTDRYHLHFDGLVSSYAKAFEFIMWPHWITYTLLSGFIGYLFGKKVEYYKKLSEYVANFQLIGKQASTIIHDLNNPLGVIKIHIQLLKEETRGTDKEKDCDVLLGETTRLENMVKSIKTAVKGNIQNNIKKTPVNLKKYLEHTVSKLNFKSRVKIFGDKVEKVKIDRDYFERVVWNIIKNAEESFENSERTRIDIKIKDRQNKKVTLIFEDNGPGLSPEESGELFNFGLTEGKKEGTGIGLYNCKKIVEAHGGNITADSGGEKGLKIVINLPK